MESPFERGIFFDMAFVFGESGRADETDVASGECGLQDIGGIQSAGSIAGTDERMNFIDEEDDIRRVLYFADELFQARFEFSAETGSGDDEREVERENPFFREEIAGRSFSDFFRERGHERGFSDTRIAEEEGIVFLFPTEYVNEPFDLMRSPDEGLRLGIFVEVDGVLVEEWGFGVCSSFFPREADFWQMEHFRERRHMIIAQMRMDGIE